MAQQISIEAALAAFRQKCGELVDENVLLKAHVTELEQQLAAAQAPESADPESSSAPSYLTDSRA